MILSNIRGELRTAIELLEKKATAAEKVVYKELVFLHNGLTQVEGQIVVISLKAAKEYQKLLSAAKAEISELEAAIKHSETHADAVAKANAEAQTQAAAQGQPVPAPAAPETPPETPIAAPAGAATAAPSA